MNEDLMNGAIETLEGAIATPVVAAPIIPCRSKKSGWVTFGFGVGVTLLGIGAVFGVPKLINHIKSKKYSKAEVQAKVVKPDNDDDEDFFEVPDDEKK